jgi:hypothetical protein
MAPVHAPPETAVNVELGTAVVLVACDPQDPVHVYVTSAKAVLTSPFSSIGSVVTTNTSPACTVIVEPKLRPFRFVPVAWAETCSEVNPTNDVMNRETKPTKTRETTNRFGIAELSIGALLKVSLYKILPFSY